jgi:hypothetical protein
LGVPLPHGATRGWPSPRTFGTRLSPIVERIGPKISSRIIIPPIYCDGIDRALVYTVTFTKKWLRIMQPRATICLSQATGQAYGVTQSAADVMRPTSLPWRVEPQCH